MDYKKYIFDRLIQANGNPVSGGALASELHISRMAVNKYIARLRSEGYDISSSTRTGYKLIHAPDILNWDSIAHSLSTPVNGEVLDSIDSTNTELKRRLLSGFRGPFVLLSDEQTAGRGRQGKSYYAPKGSGLYLSLLLHPDAPVSDVVSVTSRAAVAVCRAIQKVTDLPVGIKWVNDIYLHGKKLCGILVEAVTDFETGITGSLIIGVGINVSHKAFPPDVPNAISIDMDALSRNELAAAVIEELLSVTYDFTDMSFMKEYRDNSIVLGKNVMFIRNGELHHGYAEEIDDEGGLIVKDDSGKCQVLRSGEITLRVE